MAQDHTVYVDEGKPLPRGVMGTFQLADAIERGRLLFATGAYRDVFVMTTDTETGVSSCAFRASASTFSTELTPIGEQYVVPGCEREAPKNGKPFQLNLWR